MSNNWFLVRRCGYCGQDFTEWHECAGTEREKRQWDAESKTTRDTRFLDQLEQLLSRSKK